MYKYLEFGIFTDFVSLAAPEKTENELFFAVIIKHVKHSPKSSTIFSQDCPASRQNFIRPKEIYILAFS
jgi:hypothetical protein